MGLPQGIKVSLSSSLADLVKVVFHEIQDKYDRRGEIATFIFKKYINQPYQIYVTTNTLRAIVSLLSPTYAFMDINEYGDEELNDCWTYHRVKGEFFTITIKHKYWGEGQLIAFKEIVLAIAKLRKVEVEDNSNY